MDATNDPDLDFKRYLLLCGLLESTLLIRSDLEPGVLAVVLAHLCSGEEPPPHRPHRCAHRCGRGGPWANKKCGDQLSKGLRKPLGVREIDTAKASPCLSAAGGRTRKT